MSSKIPFDLEKAKRGEKVVAWNGWPVRIICFDRNEYKSVVALIKDPESNKESVYCFKPNGEANDSATRLYMAEKMPNGFKKGSENKVCRTCRHWKITTANMREKCRVLPNKVLDTEAFDSCKQWEAMR